MYRRVYFDNAASSFPKPQSVVYAVQNILKTNTSNPGRSGHYMSSGIAKEVYSVRKKIADFFGTDETLTIFTQNATHAINLLFFGLLERGDEVIISDLEHNAVLRPLHALKKRGVTFKIFETGNKSVENCEHLITENTKLIFITGASNVTGETLPVRQIAEVAKNITSFSALTQLKAQASFRMICKKIILISYAEQGINHCLEYRELDFF